MESLQSRRRSVGQSRGVSLWLIGLVILTIVIGCITKKSRQGNCKGYELRHYQIKEGAGMFVHGRIRVCETRKIVARAKVRFVSNDGKVYEATADKRGYYEIRLPSSYFVGKVVAFGKSASFTVEDAFFGYTNASELNINLYNFNTIYNEIELLKSDIIHIRDNSKKRAQDTTQ